MNKNIIKADEEKDIVINITNSLPVNSITKTQLAKIESRLPELYRAKAMIGHSHSQASYALQTLAMIDDSPMSRMKQCLSNIEHKYQAVKEAYFKIENIKLEIKELESTKPVTESARLKIMESETNIISTQNAMGNALREIGMFQDFYEAIRKSNDISEVWTEHDYEEQEIANMIRKSFRIGIQAVSNGGSVSIAAVEYWEQLGIHPQSAEAHCRNYLQQVQKIINEGREPDVRVMYEFLDGMAEKFKDSYKFALDRIGLKELGSEEFRIGN